MYCVAATASVAQFQILIADFALKRAECKRCFGHGLLQIACTATVHPPHRGPGPGASAAQRRPSGYIVQLSACGIIGQCNCKLCSAATF